MRIALAAIFQLTNTFSLQPTPPEAFTVDSESGSPQLSCDPYRVRQMVNLITAASLSDTTSVHSVMIATARSSGAVTRETTDALAHRLETAIGEPGDEYDALILIMSGAMFDADGEPVEFEFVRSAKRALPPSAPVVALLSSDAILDERMINSVNLVLEFDVSHEAEMADTANQATRLTEKLIRREIQPICSLKRLPLLMSPQARQEASRSLDSVRALAREFEARPDILSAGLFPGFPFADVSSAGFHVLVTTDRDGEAAHSCAERLRNSIWDLREAFDVRPENVETAVHTAMLSEDRPVVVLDSGDDPAMGATGDGTGLLWALIDLGAPEVALGVIVDPQGVNLAIESGEGADILFDVGGCFDRRAGYPINVTAVVRHIVDPSLTQTDGCTIDVGRTVVLDVEGRHGGQIDLILCERAPAVIGPNLFDAVGIDTSTKRIVAAKFSGSADLFTTISKQILRTSTPGITTPVLNYFEFSRITRPIFPLDPI